MYSLKWLFSFLAIVSISLFGCRQKPNNQSDTNGTGGENQESQKETKSPYAASQLKIELPKSDNTRLSNSQKPQRQSLAPLKEVNLSKPFDGSPSAAMPDFRKMNSAERKEAFKAYLRPVIKAENARLMELRYMIKQMYAGVNNRGQTLSDNDKEWLVNLARKYRSEPRDFPSNEAFRSLLMHVDVIPLKLAIAQAAHESAWGTSRFAVVGNNLFGQWCFKKGCGIVPARRQAGATHEVAAFSTSAEAVQSYMHNLNSHPAYRQLRVVRYQQREKNQIPDGHAMAIGLQKYSARGMTYVNLIRDMIKNQELTS